MHIDKILGWTIQREYRSDLKRLTEKKENCQRKKKEKKRNSNSGRHILMGKMAAMQYSQRVVI